MKVSKVKSLIRNAKCVYVFEPLTEGYIQVVKSNYILILDDLDKRCELDCDMICMRGEDLYIN